MNISIQIKRQKFLVLPLQHFVHGLKKVKFVLLELHPTKECIVNRIYTTLLGGILLLKRKQKSFMLGYLPKSKWMTLTDKQIFSDPNTLITSWLQTLALELIGKEKDLKPFWNSACLEMSQKLWLPTEIDSVGSHSNYLNLSYSKQELNSWFTIQKKTNPQTKNWQRTSSPLSTFTPVETWEEEGIRARKIRIYPTLNQQKQLKKWMGTTRFVYNRALHALKTEENQKWNFMNLRNRFVSHKRRTGEINEEVNDWELETPKDIRAECLRDLVKAYSVAITNIKRGNIHHFKMRYRKKKYTPTIVIPKTAISTKNKELFIYKRFITESIRVSRDKSFSSIKFEYDCRLQYKHGKWYLIVPIKTTINSKTNKDSLLCALDPGVRTFQTIYSETEVVKIQQNTELLTKLHNRLDLFQSLRSTKQISKNHYTRRVRRIYRRIDSLIDDLHFKTISYLRSKYSWILLPSFESQEMVSNGFSRKCNRNMMQLKHYQFKERLKSACLLDRSSDVTIVTEEYTSKTCTGCGQINDNLSGKRIFDCSSCGITIDRDINGARNILLKYLNRN